MENEIIFTELQLHGKLVGGGNQGFDGDAEFTVQDRSRRGSTEVIAADGLASVLGPAEGGASFDGDSLGVHGGRQDGFSVGVWRSKASQHGMETTRTFLPLAASSSPALTASSSSVPVPMRMQSQASPAAAPATTYAPLAAPSMEVPARFGTT